MSSGNAINIAEATADSKGKEAVAAVKATKVKGGWRRGIAIFDFILRLFAIAAALAAAAAMGTTDQTLPFFTQFFQFQASYDDLPALTLVIFHVSMHLRGYSVDGDSTLFNLE